MNKAYIYGYFATQDFDYTNKDKVFHFKDGECFYIGISTNSIEERHANHLKPSKINDQTINGVLQKNGGKWQILELGEIKMLIDFSKELIHKIEMEMVNNFKPQLNTYGK